MRLTISTLCGQAKAPRVMEVIFADDGEALSEVWRILSCKSRRPELVDIIWERSDGASVRYDALVRWASER